MLSITVSDPEKHGTSAHSAFVDFKIHSVVHEKKNTNFQKNDFFVRRRYRDFVWLRNQLTLTHPECVLPPLPTLDSNINYDRFSTPFITTRQAGLQHFLQRIARHDKLAASDELRTFLEAKVWELQTVKNASSSSWYSRIFDGTEASFQRLQQTFTKKVPDEAAVEPIRTFTNEYTSVVSTASSRHNESVRTLRDIGDDLSQLGPSFDLLSQTETELSLPFTNMAEALERIRGLYDTQVQTEHISGLSALLAFNAGTASSLKDVLCNRDAALIAYQRAVASLESYSSERQKWQKQRQKLEQKDRSSMLGKLDELFFDPSKGEKLNARVVEAERELAAAKAKWEVMSNSIHAEAEAFHRDTAADFSEGLRKYIDGQIEFQRKQQAEWRKLLDIWRRIETEPSSSFKPARSFGGIPSTKLAES